jgi:hypothetical protein
MTGDNRTIFVMREGQTTANAQRLSDVLAERYALSLYVSENQLVQLVEDRLIPISRDLLAVLVHDSVAGVRLTIEGDRYTPELVPLTLSRDELLVLMEAMLTKMAKAPPKHRDLPGNLRREITDRVQSGEALEQVARSYSAYGVTRAAVSEITGRR